MEVQVLLVTVFISHKICCQNLTEKCNFDARFLSKLYYSPRKGVVVQACVGPVAEIKEQAKHLLAGEVAEACGVGHNSQLERASGPAVSAITAN